MIEHQICLMCHSDKGSHKLNKLRKMLDILSVAQKSKGAKRSCPIAEYLVIYDRCRYGIWCPELDRVQNESRNLGRRIQKAIEETDETYFIDSLLELMRGDFPQAYRILELEKVRRMP